MTTATRSPRGRDDDHGGRHAAALRLARLRRRARRIRHVLWRARRPAADAWCASGLVSSLLPASPADRQVWTDVEYEDVSRTSGWRARTQALRRFSNITGAGPHPRASGRASKAARGALLRDLTLLRGLVLPGAPPPRLGPRQQTARASTLFFSVISSITGVGPHPHASGRASKRRGCPLFSVLSSSSPCPPTLALKSARGPMIRRIAALAAHLIRLARAGRG